MNILVESKNVDILHVCFLKLFPFSKWQLFLCCLLKKQILLLFLEKLKHLVLINKINYKRMGQCLNKASDERNENGTILPVLIADTSSPREVSTLTREQKEIILS
jgi:hypothetical protein